MGEHFACFCKAFERLHRFALLPVGNGFIGERLSGLTFAKVFTSPLQRAMRTCALAGFASVAQVDADLLEWDYGDYEGRRTAEIHAERPDWRLFRDGCPGGESPEQIGT